MEGKATTLERSQSIWRVQNSNANHLGRANAHSICLDSKPSRTRFKDPGSLRTASLVCFLLAQARTWWCKEASPPVPWES